VRAVVGPAGCQRRARSDAPYQVGARKAFTLVELLVVISIMGLIAALIVGVAKHATDQKKITRVTTELGKWITMIDNYHDKLGFYPPCNPQNPYGPAVNALYYELAGAMLNGSTYTTLTTSSTVTKANVAAAFGLQGIANSATEVGEATSFGRNIQASDVLQVTLPGLNSPVQLLRVSVAGPPPYGVTNTWHYNSKNPTNNPNSYDLWAEIQIGSQTRIIGNWKR
jgi:prepilin-type N-terminal cleavage/methylation domain-containing protein